MNLYLDVCCLNRPFDDRSEPRVAIESEAVLEVLGAIDAGRWIDFSSDMARILPLDATLLDAAGCATRCAPG